jgi:hypothetical protein
VNEQVKAGLSAIRDFLAGRSGEAKVATTEDQGTREVVAAELLATMSGPNTAAATPEQKPAPSAEYETERERARQLFMDHGYFDEAVLNLRAANSGAERAAAARVLGLVGSERGAAHLVAALFDDDPEVRQAAEEALGKIGDASVSKAAEAALHAPANNESQTNAVEETTTAMDQQDTPVIVGSTEQVVMISTQDAVSEDGVREGDAIARGGLDAHGPSEEVTSDAPNIDSLQSPVPQTIKDEGIASEVVLAHELTHAAEVVSAPEPTTTRQPVIALESNANSEVMAPDVSGVDSLATHDAEQPPIEEGSQENTADGNDESNIRETLAQLQSQLLETVSLRQQSEQEIAQSADREVRLRTEAAARRAEEEEIRKQADEESERRRAREREALMEEQATRAQAEADAQRLTEEETSLRLQAAELKQTAERLAREREDREAAHIEAAETARRAEATRARDEAQARHDDELNQLRNEEEWLRAKTEEIARLKAEITAAREKADADAERLIETETRIRAAEEVRARAEAERMQFEAEIRQRVDTARAQLEDTRRRGQEEQERLQEETRRRAEAERQRRTDLDAMKVAAEANSRELAELEQQTLAHVNSLRIADTETRKRIADAEARRRTAEDAYRLVAEQVQRIEAEAHARAQEEEQTRAKLEAERRTVAIEAQSRADQEKRIRDEIEMFHRLEEQERPRVEEAILQRAEAEARLRYQRERFKLEEEGRLRAEEELSLPGSVEEFSGKQTAATEPHDSSLTIATAINEQTRQAATQPGDVSEGATVGAEQIQVQAQAQAEAAGAAPAITAYLNSVDPYKRAAAVAELARSRPPDAFALITNCFDDHSPHVRNAAARALRKLEPGRSVDLFNRALEEASEERRRNIGAAIAASGVATEAIENLAGENREDTYSALSILFVMAKTGEVEPLERALLEHLDDEVGKAVAKLLALSGHR